MSTEHRRQRLERIRSLVVEGHAAGELFDWEARDLLSLLQRSESSERAAEDRERFGFVR